MEGLSSLEPVSRESTASLIAKQLRTAIMYGSLPAGSQLGESELAARLGVSRGPLREAMQRLVQEGLLSSERNRGLFVTALEPADVRDIYVARGAIERAAATLVLRADPADAAGRLTVVHERMVAAARRSDYPALSNADLEFHETLVAASGSTRLARMAGTLLVETRMCMTALQGTYRVPTEIVLEHGAIVDAIRGGNERALLRLVDEHMDDALQRLLSPADREGGRAVGRRPSRRRAGPPARASLPGRPAG